MIFAAREGKFRCSSVLILPFKAVSKGQFPLHENAYLDSVTKIECPGLHIVELARSRRLRSPDCRSE